MVSGVGLSIHQKTYVPERGCHEWVRESQPGEPPVSAGDLRTRRANRLYANLSTVSLLFAPHVKQGDLFE